MNIWIFNHYAITPNLPGGTRHYDLSKELVKRHYNVTIFAASFHHSQHKEIKKYKSANFIIEEFDGIKFVWLKTYPYSKNDWKRVVNMLSYSLKAYKVGSNKKLENPDLIIGSSVHLFAVYTAYSLSKKFRVPFIMEVRDLWPKTLIHMGISKLHPFVIILRILEKYLYKNAKKIITLLPNAYKYIENLGIERNKMAWIPNGVNLERFKDVFKSKKADSQFIVMYLGSHGKANALDTLLDAAKITQEKKYTKIRFILAGDGTEKNHLIRYKDTLGLKNTEFYQAVKKIFVPNILEKADVLVSIMRDLPLYRYGVSANKHVDYAASKKPIILVGNPINNIVKEARCGITTPPEDPPALANAIIKLYNMSKKERMVLGERGKKYVKKFYSIPVLVDKLEKIITELYNKK